MFSWLKKKPNNTQHALPIAISMGEPAGIGIECLFKAWQQRHSSNLPAFFVIADPENMEQQKNILGHTIKFAIIDNPRDALAVFDTALPILPLALKRAVNLGKPNPANAPLVLESIKKAALFALNGEAAALVTLPIHKSTLYQSGFHFGGHTEYLASLCESTKPTVMMLETDELRIALSTVHLSLKDAIGKISSSLIVNNSLTVERALRENFGIEKPRLAVAALNPHAGENGAMGLEEIELIQPAIDQLKERGLHVTGPFPADTMFHAQARKNYDCAICLYHDQGLIPIKTLDFYGGVNITLGLPIIRTSPDHGTAFDIAGKNIASAASLIRALQRAQEMAKRAASHSAKAA